MVAGTKRPGVENRQFLNASGKHKRQTVARLPFGSYIV